MTRRITVAVYEDDATTLVRTLTADADRQWLDDLRDVGSFSFTVLIGHADDSACTDGRLVKFSVDGTVRFAGIIEPSDKTLADPQQRAAGRIRTVQGRGVLALLERAVVFPELDLGRVSPPMRNFSWVSGDFDDSGWLMATAELKQVSDPTSPWPGAPEGFFDSSAYWIGKTGDSTPGVAPGVRRARKQYTIASGDEGDHVIQVAADDGWRLWVDGDEAGSERGVGAWGQVYEIQRYLDVGVHTFALEWENYDRPNPGTNVTGAVLAVAPLEGGKDPGAHIVHTDSTWKLDDNPDAAPGMSVGSILNVLLDEAHARNTLLDVTTDTSASLDSNGNAWVNPLDVAFPVRTTYLEVIGHLDDEHAAEFWMTDTLVVKAAPRRGSDLSATVTLTYGVTFGRLRTTHKPPGPNRVLAQTAEGRWVLVEDTAAITAYGAREVGLDLGAAPSDTAAERQAEAFLDDFAAPGDAIVDAQVEEVTGAVPYVDWGVGDTVSVNTGLGTADHRVESLAVGEDEAGQPIFTPELVPVA